MSAFSLWKQLKRRLRRNRRPLWTLGGIVLLLLGAGATTLDTVKAANYEPSISSMFQALDENGETAAVVLHRIYVCGEEREMLGRMSAAEIVKLLAEHPEWSAMAERDGRTVRLEQQVNDLSSHCKSHAYFGIDRHGNFSLFDGEPSDDNVMRTFFQLDIRYMESSLPPERLDQLTQGIRVSDIDEYNSVLSSFSDFAMESSESERQAY